MDPMLHRSERTIIGAAAVVVATVLLSVIALAFLPADPATYVGTRTAIALAMRTR